MPRATSPSPSRICTRTASTRPPSTNCSARRAGRTTARRRWTISPNPYLKLTAPIAGHVVERDVITGQHIEPQKMLLTVSDLSTLWALLDARETDLPHVAPRPAGAHHDQHLPGPRLARARRITSATSWTRRRAPSRSASSVRNDGRLLKPNMFIQGELPDAVSTRDVLTAPPGRDPDDWRRVGRVRSRGRDKFVARPVETRRPRRQRGARCVGDWMDAERSSSPGAFNLKAELLKSTLAGE